MQSGPLHYHADSIAKEFHDRGVVDVLGRQYGLNMNGPVCESLAAYLNLICEWNEFASLTSVGDLAKLIENHLVDSVSLVPYVMRFAGAEGVLLDVGSGGGFPAIPIKVLCPDLKLILVERVARKVGFLRKVVATLGLKSVTIQHGEFLWNHLTNKPAVVTARAVERSEEVVRTIISGMESRCSFLCQSGNPQSLVGTMFHVEHIDDEWQARGLRRGDLYLVTRKP